MQARVERLELLVEQLQGEIRALRAIVGVGAEDFEVVASTSTPRAPVRSEFGLQALLPLHLSPSSQQLGALAGLRALG